MRSLTLVLLIGCGTAEPPPSPQHAQPTAAVQPANHPPPSTASPSTARVAFGDSSLALPDGWSEIKREPDRVTFRSAEQTEQTTVSKLDLSTVPSFEDFKLICQHRLDAEHQASKDEFLEVTGPTNAGNTYKLLFSGGEKASQLVFSGYMVVAGKTIMTVYVEGIGVSPERHLASFKAFVTGFRP